MADSRTAIQNKQRTNISYGVHPAWSKIGLVSAKCDYQHLVIHNGGNLTKYQIKRGAAAHRVEEASDEINDGEYIYQLHSSLPEHYDTVLDWYENLLYANCTYKSYCQKLLEKFEQLTKIH